MICDPEVNIKHTPEIESEQPKNYKGYFINALQDHVIGLPPPSFRNSWLFLKIIIFKHPLDNKHFPLEHPPLRETPLF